MWAASFTGQDCDVQQVMDGLAFDRDGDQPLFLSKEQRKMRKKTASLPHGSEFLSLDKTEDKTATEDKTTTEDKSASAE